MKRYLLLIGIIAALLGGPAKADWTGLNATGVAITFKNPNACTSVACVPIAQPVDSTGASFGVTANPFFIGFGTGVTLPAYASPPTVNLGTIGGVATQTTLASVLSTLGSPFQAGGSIGNTSFAATQSGTWNITNLSGTVSLPTGAATAAKQPALGTAGAASTDILTVQGIASMTPLLATLSGTNNINNISGTISLPTGAATSALQTTGNTALTTINTTLGSPFQAGGSIGNSTFAVTQATAANLNMTCANCSGSGASGTDEGGFTAGSSVFAPGGGFFQTTATSNPLTTGQWGAWQMTANRAGFVNLRNASGTEIGTSSTPVQVSVANTGANATAMLVTGTGGTFPATQSGVWSTTVTQATAANLNATVAPSTLAAWGLTASTQNGSTPTNAQLGMGQFNTSPTTITSGNVSPLQLDASGNLLVNIKAGAGSGGTALTDQAAFTQGTTSITPIGCLFIGSYSAITTGHAGVASCTSAGALNVQVSNTNVNGSATSANSAPVVIASDQAAVAVKAASGAYVAGSIADLAHGSAVSAASVPVVVASDQGAIATKAASASYASGSMVDITNLSGATGSAVPAKAAYAGAVSSGSLTGIIQADASVQINISTATTTQIVALTSGQKIYVTSFDVVAAGTGSFSLVYGTGTNCGTGTTVLAGPYSFTAQSGISKGSGLGPVLIVPAGNALCEVNTAAVAMNGSASYTKF